MDQWYNYYWVRTLSGQYAAIDERDFPFENFVGIRVIAPSRSVYREFISKLDKRARRLSTYVQHRHQLMGKNPLVLVIIGDQHLGSYEYDINSQILHEQALADRRSTVAYVFTHL